MSEERAVRALEAIEHAHHHRSAAEAEEAAGWVEFAVAYDSGLNRPTPLAAEGTPAVDEFGVLELSAALRRSRDSVRAQLVDLLNLAYRLPQLWELVRQARLPVWQARRLAARTAKLSAVLAGWVDATLAPFAESIGPNRLEAFCDALVAQADPALAAEAWERAKAWRSVQFEPTADPCDGVRRLYGLIDTADAVWLDSALNQLAGILARQGATDPHSQLRATALGILATPARALAMIQHDLTQPALTDHHSADDDAIRVPADDEAGRAVAGLAGNPATAGEPAPVEVVDPATGEIVPAPGDVLVPASGELVPASGRVLDSTGELLPAGGPVGGRRPAGCAGHVCGTITVHPDRLLPKATLVVHLSDAAIGDPRGICRVEGIGPVPVGQLHQLLGHARVRVLPVFDPDGVVPVDSYEIPAATRRAVLLRHPWEMFPYSTASHTGCDLDHTDPWRPDGPAGQTRPDNLTPLRRPPHRAKTHADWKLRTPAPGIFVWTTPLGRRYTLTPDGLTHTGPPPDTWSNPARPPSADAGPPGEPPPMLLPDLPAA
jgi:hypothetical protein